MKNILNIAILIGLTAFVSSCQKEDLPYPAGSSGTEIPANFRLSGAPQTVSDTVHSTIDEARPDIDEVVGDGDDDRDGGGKRVVKGN